MARNSRNRKEIEEQVAELVKSILESGTLSKESFEAIEGRSDIVKKIVKTGSNDNWDNKDPNLVGGLLSIVIEEYIYNNMENSDHREFAGTLVGIIDDTEERPTRSTSGKEKEAKLTSGVNTYFNALYRFLKSNEYDTRPSFAMFGKYVDKFNARKLAEEPEVESNRVLFDLWEKWVIKK